MAMSVAGSPAIVATLLQHNLHRQEPTAAPCQSAARPERSPAVGGVDATLSGSFRNAQRCCRAAARVSDRTEDIADGICRIWRVCTSSGGGTVLVCQTPRQLSTSKRTGVTYQ